MFSVTITSNSAGRLTSCIAALSTRMWSRAISGWRVPTSLTTSRHRREVSRTLALSTEVTLPRRPAAAWKADLGDALDLGARVLARVVGAIALTSPSAEVDAPGQLAHHEQIGARDALAPQGARVPERLERLDRAQVREQPEARAQAEQPLLGARLGRVGRVPLGPADRAQQHRIGRLAGRQHIVGQRGAVGIDRAAAHELLAPGDRQIRRRRRRSRRPGSPRRRPPARCRHPAAPPH